MTLRRPVLNAASDNPNASADSTRPQLAVSSLEIFVTTLFCSLFFFLSFSAFSCFVSLFIYFCFVLFDHEQLAQPTSPNDQGRARSLTKQTNIRRNHIAKEVPKKKNKKK